MIEALTENLPLYKRVAEILESSDIDLPVDERLKTRMLVNYATIYVQAQRDLLKEQGVKHV